MTNKMTHRLYWKCEKDTYDKKTFDYKIRFVGEHYFKLFTDEHEIENLTYKIEGRPDDIHKTHYGTIDSAGLFNCDYDLTDYLVIEVFDEHKTFLADTGFSTKNGKSIWIPEKPQNCGSNKSYWDSPNFKEQPKYHFYIISHRRPEQRLTEDMFKECGITNYTIVVKEGEKEEYESHGAKNVVECPNSYIEEQNSIMNEGSIPQRNYIHHHLNKDEYYWLWDDNIRGIRRWVHSSQRKVKSTIPFCWLENYTLSYSNLYMSGFNYFSMVPEVDKAHPSIAVNRAVYSNFLIHKDLHEKILPSYQADQLWEGKYNEDTDLSIRCMLSGLPLFVYNSFLIEKATSLTCKGGNTDTIYQDGGYEAKYRAIKNKWPNYINPCKKFKRDVHHNANYKKVCFDGGTRLPMRLLILKPQSKFYTEKLEKELIINMV